VIDGELICFFEFGEPSVLSGNMGPFPEAVPAV
jgi:hypothetical protein